MTLKEALAETSGKLVFGDENQIIARKFLEKTEAAADKIRACNVCREQMKNDEVLKIHRCTEEFDDDVRRAAWEKING